MLGPGEAKSCEPGHRACFFLGRMARAMKLQGAGNPCAGGFGRARSYASSTSGGPNIQGVQALKPLKRVEVVEASKLLWAFD